MSINALKNEISALTEQLAPALLALPGCGPLTAAKIIGATAGVDLVALRRADFDMGSGTVRVWRKFAEVQDGRRVAGPPESTARTRTVVLPRVLVEVMAHHVATRRAGPRGLGVPGPHGAALRRNNFHRSVHWAEVVKDAGLPAGFHFYDLRHTGNNLTAASGASTRELMHRMDTGACVLR